MFDVLRRAAAVVILVVTISACLPAVTPAPQTTPYVLTIQRTQALAPLADLFDRCINEQPNTGLVLQEISAGSMDVSRARLTLRWGSDTTSENYIAVVGEEELVLVVNLQNQVAGIGLEEVRAIYSGGLKEWPEAAAPGEIQAWSYPAGDDIQQNFESAINSGEVLRSSRLYLAPGPAEIIEAVSQSPAAVGFIPRRWLNDQVKEVQVQGLEVEKLVFPILSISRVEPTGAEKAWLLCLQEQLR